MARDDRKQEKPGVSAKADISLVGTVDQAMAEKLRDQLGEAEAGEGPVTIDITTLGGDPEMARRMIVEIDAARERLEGRRLVFVGKTAVYSAGTTMMGGFPVADRYLTRDAVLLLHCRQMEKTMQLQGPLASSRIQLGQVLEEVENGMRLEREGFQTIIEGSDVSLDEICERAMTSWYVPAAEALERRLIAGVV